MRYIASRIASANRSASSLHDDGRPAVVVPRAASSRWRSDVVVIIFDVGDNDDARAPQPPPYNPSSHTERPRESALRGVDVGVRDATSVIRTTGFDSIRKQTRYTDSDRRPTRRRPPIPPLIYQRRADFIPLRRLPRPSADRRRSRPRVRDELMERSIAFKSVSLVPLKRPSKSQRLSFTTAIRRRRERRRKPTRRRRRKLCTGARRRRRRNRRRTGRREDRRRDPTTRVLRETKDDEDDSDSRWMRRPRCRFLRRTRRERTIVDRRWMSASSRRRVDLARVPRARVYDEAPRARAARARARDTPRTRFRIVGSSRRRTRPNTHR